jgi:hypothetical protein
MKTDRITRSPSRDRVLAVEAGQLVCPRQGLVDLERCWMCSAYAGLSTTRLEGVICRADLGDLDVGILPFVR